MATYNYSNTVKELIDNQIVGRDEVYWYDLSPRAILYAKHFQFCQENLSERCEEFGIQPAKFFFKEENTVNAKATLKHNYYVISINKAVINDVYNIMYDNNRVFETSEFSVYEKLNLILDVPVDFILYQTVIQFAYYHELAHLIQFSNRKSHSDSEYYSISEREDNEVFSLMSHVYEFDADIHASNMIFKHLVFYLKKFSDLDPDDIGRMLSVSLSSILSFFILITDAPNYNLYYKKNRHPHPIIRITYIWTLIVDAMKNEYPQIKEKEIMNEAFRITTHIFKQLDIEDVSNEYREILNINQDSIREYIFELINVANDVPELVINTIHKKKS